MKRHTFNWLKTVFPMFQCFCTQFILSTAYLLHTVEGANKSSLEAK